MARIVTHLMGVVIAGVNLSSASYVAAQEQAIMNDNRCWFLSESYTAGASVRASSEVMVCGSDGVWSVAEEGGGASGCLYDHKLFGTGAIVAIKDGPTITCGIDGSWSK